MQLLFQVSPPNIQHGNRLLESPCLLRRFLKPRSCWSRSLCLFCLHPLCAPISAPGFSPPQVESNPFPFNYVANYTVSTEVASMEFRTENGTHIPISGLDDALAITVAVNNGSAGAGGVPTAGVVNISSCDSVVARVSMGNANRQAGLFVQLNFTSQQGERSLFGLLCSHLHREPKGDFMSKQL